MTMPGLDSAAPAAPAAPPTPSLAAAPATAPTPPPATASAAVPVATMAALTLNLSEADADTVLLMAKYRTGGDLSAYLRWLISEDVRRVQQEVASRGGQA